MSELGLYHQPTGHLTPQAWWILLLVALVLGACSTSVINEEQISITISADNKKYSLNLPAGSTVQQAINTAGLALGPLDRTEPPLFTVLASGAIIRLIRVTEKFDVEQVIIPFENQTLRNESLAMDMRVYLQQGKNGLQENTIRRVFEDGVETSRNWVKSIVVDEPVPEIVMTGVQAPFITMPVPGRLVYLRDGNAWKIEASTGERKAVVTTGDLDGYIFDLSTDGDWLLFTRRAQEEGQINTLWAARIDSDLQEPIDLEVENVLYFAAWLPESTRQVVYSTVTPQVAAPGWKSNNDLKLLTIIAENRMNHKEIEIKSNLGGVYPWWGISYAWAPDGLRLGYANDHAVGLLDLIQESATLVEVGSRPLLEFPPLNTRASWAWVPGFSWSPDGSNIYASDHSPAPGVSQPEESQRFNLSALPLVGSVPLQIISDAGMFAYPLVSPAQSASSGEQGYSIAYLQAAFPQQSQTSRYRLMVMDRDGSNRRVLFPEPDLPGITPQRDWGAWSPQPMPESENFSIAIIHQGNLWLVDADNGTSTQITSDGLTTRVVWKIIQS
jgi:hypothetical protein